jgi:phage-related minor tail protein
MLAAPAWADYDAALEAREAAQRKAEQQEAARKKAEVARLQADNMAKYQREFVGAEAKGKSDAEVKQLYDRKMAAINKQAADAQKTYSGGKYSPEAMKNMSNEEAQALAREMQKTYGK